MDEFGKLRHEWIPADMRAASAEKPVAESGVQGQKPITALAREAEDLRAFANAARNKVTNFVLTAPGAVRNGQG